jgi:hypothetical protein
MLPGLAGWRQGEKVHGLAPQGKSAPRLARGAPQNFVALPAFEATRADGLANAVARLQLRAHGDGMAQRGALGDVTAIGAAKFLPQLYLSAVAHVGRHLGQIAHALQDSVK